MDLNSQTFYDAKLSFIIKNPIFDLNMIVRQSLLK